MIQMKCCQQCCILTQWSNFSRSLSFQQTWNKPLRLLHLQYCELCYSWPTSSDCCNPFNSLQAFVYVRMQPVHSEVFAQLPSSQSLEDHELDQYASATFLCFRSLHAYSRKDYYSYLPDHCGRRFASQSLLWPCSAEMNLVFSLHLFDQTNSALCIRRCQTIDSGEAFLFYRGWFGCGYPTVKVLHHFRQISVQMLRRRAHA